MELCVLVLPSEVVPNERRIKIVAQDAETLREQVLEKLKLPVETELAVYEVHGQTNKKVLTLDQLEDKPKLKVLRSLTEDDSVNDRRARMKSAFSLISESTDAPDVSTPTSAISAADTNEADEDGEDVPGTTFIRYYNVDGLPYYYNRETGETQWNEPQVSIARSPPLATTPVAAEASDGFETGQPSARTVFSTGQAVLVNGRHAEVWDVVRVDGDLVQIKLRGEAIKKTVHAQQLTAADDYPADQGTIEDDPESEPQRAQNLVPVPTVVHTTGTHKLRVLVLDSIETKKPGEPAGFVMVAPCASLVDVREEIREDELEVPDSFSFLVDGDLVKSAQEKKVHAEHFVPHGHVYVVPDPDVRTVVKPAGEPIGASVSANSLAAPETRGVSGGDNKLPVLVGHLSKCVRFQLEFRTPLHYAPAAHMRSGRKEGQMPFSAWQKRYFRLSNGTLSYFVAPDDKVAKGSIVIDETCTVVCAGEKYKKKFCFEVSWWKSQLALCAECEDDCELWKTHIKLTVKAVKALAAERGIMRGLVDKRDSGFMRKWREKWAVVSRTTLSFYDAPDDPARQRPPSDEFELLGATVEVAAFRGDRHFCFTVVPLQREPIELSTRQKDDLEDWVRMLRSNIEGTTMSMAPTARPSWGVQSTAVEVEQHDRASSSSGWFDVQGIDPKVSVITSRQRTIDGQKTTEYYICITRSCASLSWHISRKLQDILDLHEAISNTDPTKHEYLDKFIQLPREKQTKLLTPTELKQHCKLVQVYAEEALKQAGPVEYSALRLFFCPTDKGFDQHRGRLTIQRQARTPLPAQCCWCELRGSDHTFSWSLDEHSKDGIEVSLKDSILITQKKLLPSTTAGFELILPERGIRLLISSNVYYAVIQWIECLKPHVSHVVSEDAGLLTVNNTLSVEVTPLEPVLWLGALTPDHTAMHIDPLWSRAADHASGGSVPITDPRLLVQLREQDHGSPVLGINTSYDKDHDVFDDEREGEWYDEDGCDSCEDDTDEFHEHPIASNRRLSATMETSDSFFCSNRHWNDGATVVLDTGSYAVKAGLACDSFPSVVARSFDLATGSPLVYREHVGAMTTEAAVRVCSFSLYMFPDVARRHPTCTVCVTDHNELGCCGICPADHNFVMTEAPDMTRVSKRKMAEIMFEYFNVPAITIQSAGVLALYAQGIWTGVVVDCGNRTKITPVYEGTVLPHAVMQSCFGGIDVDNALTSMLVERYGATYSRDTSSLDMQRFKEQHAFVSDSDAAAGTGAAAIASDITVKHRMSTGTNLLFDRERCLGGEELFTANLPNGCRGLAQGVQWSIQKCESVLRKQLLGSILLCGGTTCIGGFPERLRHDTTALLQSRGRDRAMSDLPKVNVIAPRNRKYTAWLGGACLAQMDDFGDRILISADEYDERGAASF